MIQLPKNETFPGRVFSRLVIRIGVLILLMGLFEVLHALQEEIKRCIEEIQPQLCGKVMKNLDEMYFTIRLKNKYLKTLFYI